MHQDVDVWRDPRNLIALGGLSIGLIGFLYGVLRDKWSRRESRLESLGKCLDPLIRAAQDLQRANNLRRQCEQLKLSFPDKPLSAVERVNSIVDKVDTLTGSAEKHFRESEIELATRTFRFPTRIAKQIKDLREAVKELGRFVNAGMFAQADLQVATFGHQYRLINETARGWRLADPFEGIARYFRTSKASSNKVESEFELSKNEMDGICELLHRRMTSQRLNTFAVHPPKKLINCPSIIEDDNLIAELKESIFTIVFQDGYAKMLSFPELMAFTFNLIHLEIHTQEMVTMIKATDTKGAQSCELSIQFTMQKIMTPEMVKTLLSKIEFSPVASEDDS